MVYGNSLKNYCVAIVVLDEAVLTQWATHVAYKEAKELCDAPEVRQTV